MGWQVQSGRPEEVVAANEYYKTKQRQYIQVACLLEWAWFTFM
jgi:hypothetical protein